jgi:uncharacterized protein
MKVFHGKIMRIVQFSLWTALFSAAQTAYGAGFDCNKASGLQEIAICSNPALSALDDRLNDAFLSLGDGKVFRLMQIDWLKRERNKCADIACLTSVYQSRIQYLTASQPASFISQEMILQERALRSDGYAVYDKESDAWPRFTLYQAESSITLIDSAVIDNVLYAILAVYSDDGATLYEYADNRPTLYPIVASSGLMLSEDYSPFNNAIFTRYSGIESTAFYFRMKETDELAQSMRYELGSGVAPVASDKVYQSPGLAERHARAVIEGTINTGLDELILRYSGGRTENVTAKTGFNYQNWIVSQPVWHSTKPVLYFDNSGAYACIWRADLWHKRLTKIVPEHEARTPLSVTLNGKEAVVYIEENQLKIAVSPN